MAHELMFNLTIIGNISIVLIYESVVLLVVIFSS